MAHSSIVSSIRPSLRSASLHWFRSEPESSAVPSRTAARRPTIRTPLAWRVLRSIVARVGVPDELERRQAAHPGDVVDLVVALVEDPGGVEPPHDVHAPVGARGPDVAADREGHRSAGAVDLVGQLDAGGRRAGDEHATVLELVGVPVVGRRQRPHGGREVGRQRRDVRHAAGAVGQHDRAAAPRPLRWS